jgi:hypothetical protein
VDVVQSRHGRANRATLQQARNGEAADQRQMFSAIAAVSHIDARASWGATSSLSTDMTPPTSSHLPQPGAILAPYQSSVRRINVAGRAHRQRSAIFLHALLLHRHPMPRLLNSLVFRPLLYIQRRYFGVFGASRI